MNIEPGHLQDVLRWQTLFSFNIETPQGLKYVWCTYLPKAFANQNLYERLMTEIEPDLDHVLMENKYQGEMLTRRRMAFYSDDNRRYSYSGVSETGVSFGRSPTLTMISRSVEESLSKKFNFALVNHYADGTENLNFHADKESELIYRHSIASVSLGATRDFMIRVRTDEGFCARVPRHIRDGVSNVLSTSKYLNKRCSKKVTLSVPLADGDLLVMGGDMQAVLEHAVPERKGVKTGRLNITLRGIKPSSSSSEN